MRTAISNTTIPVVFEPFDRNRPPFNDFLLVLALCYCKLFAKSGGLALRWSARGLSKCCPNVSSWFAVSMERWA
jgi:hypothetical protein